MVDFRTEKQKARWERDQKILAEYSELKEQPGATPNGVYRILAQSYGLKTVSSVIGVLNRTAAKLGVEL